MAHVIAQTGMGSVLDNRPAAATGALGTLAVGALMVLLASTSRGGPKVEDTADELPFEVAYVMALGSPEAEAFMEQPSVAEPSEPLDPGRTDIPGVFVAGTAAGAKDIVDTILHAGAAVAQVAAHLSEHATAGEEVLA